MTLHMIKLCVGCDSVSDLEDWVAQKLKEKEKANRELDTKFIDDIHPPYKD